MYQTDTKGDLQHKKAYDSQNPKPLFLLYKSFTQGLVIQP